MQAEARNPKAFMRNRHPVQRRSSPSFESLEAEELMGDILNDVGMLLNNWPGQDGLKDSNAMWLRDVLGKYFLKLFLF